MKKQNYARATRHLYEQAAQGNLRMEGKTGDWSYALTKKAVMVSNLRYLFPLKVQHFDLLILRPTCRIVSVLPGSSRDAADCGTTKTRKTSLYNWEIKQIDR